MAKVQIAYESIRNGYPETTEVVVEAESEAEAVNTFKNKFSDKNMKVIDVRQTGR